MNRYRCAMRRRAHQTRTEQRLARALTLSRVGDGWELLATDYAALPVSRRPVFCNRRGPAFRRAA